jgi:hypothetical protein
VRLHVPGVPDMSLVLHNPTYGHATHATHTSVRTMACSGRHDSEEVVQLGGHSVVHQLKCLTHDEKLASDMMNMNEWP